MDKNPCRRRPSNGGRGLIPVEGSGPTPVGDGLVQAEHVLPIPVGGHVQVPTYDHGLIPVVNGTASPNGLILSPGHAPALEAYNTTLGLLPASTDQRTRLTELSKRTGISNTPRDATLEAPSVKPRFQTESDQEAARRLLVARRQSDPKHEDISGGLKAVFKSPKSKTRDADPMNWVFSFDELNSALRSIILNRETVGIAEVLVSMINTASSRGSVRRLPSFSKKPVGNSHRCSHFLQEATSDRHVNMVRLLAGQADQTDLNDSLRIALDNNFPEIVEILLGYHADPRTYPQGFYNAVRSGNMLKIVELVLRSPKPIGVDYITASLPSAVSTRSPRLVSLLIAHGAVVGELALQTAIDTRDIDIVTRVLLGGPSEGVLSSAILYTLNAPTVAEKQELIERLLFAGARGEEVAESLVRVVRWGHFNVASLLVANEASVEYNDAEALSWAVSNGQPDMTELLLRGKLGERHLNTVFSKLPHSAPDDVIYKLMSMLIRKGARGDVLSIALIGSIKRRRHLIAALLIDNNASVDYGDAQALRDAILSKDLTLIETLLKGHPSTLSLERSFSLIQKTSGDVRRQMAKLFLQTGISSTGMSAALKEAIYDAPEVRDIGFIKMLVDFGADVNYLDGECLQIAAGHADIKVLELLLDSRPRVEALSSAIPFAMRLGDSRARYNVLKLLASAGAGGDGVSRGLIEVTRVDARNMEMITLFLEAKADINLEGGRSLQNAAEFGTHQTLELFIALGSPNPSSVSNALIAMLEQDGFDKPKVELLLKCGALQETIDAALVREIERPGSYRAEVVSLLLEFNADVNYMKGACMRVAVERGYNDVLNLAMGHKPSPSTLTSAFISALTLGDQGQKAAVAQRLLEAGVSGVEVHEALVEAVKDYPATSELVHILLRFGASIDYDCGRCLQVAAANGDIGLIESLLQMRPSRQSVSAAFSYVLTSDLDENQTVRMVSLFLEHASEKPDLNFDHPNFDPILFIALKRFPRSTELLQALLDAGCCVDQKIQCIIDEASGVEYATALLWALSQPGELICEPVLSTLISAGADPNFQAQASGKTPLLLAVEKSWGKVVGDLIKNRARVGVLDRHDRSALSYASERGDITSMKLILAKGAPPDDGSLHDAARGLRPDAVRLLLDHHHDSNFPSLRHGGRSALGELCLKASRNEKGGLRDTIRALLLGGADQRIEWDGKSVLLLALDNPEPFVAGAALEAGLWRGVNEEFNLFRYRGGLCYSPTLYVERGMYSGQKSEEQKKEQISLLRASRCRDRYFALDGAQPLGAVGVPEDLARLEKMRREEAERRARLKREEEEHHARVQRDHELRLRHERELAAQRQMAIANQNAAELQHQRRMVQERLDLDRKRRQEEEAAAKKIFQRNKSYYEMQKEILRLQAKAGSNARLLEFKHNDAE